MEQVDVILLMYFGDYFMATINYNFKDGCLREGSSTPGCGKALGNVKNGFVYAGSSTPGCGRKIGKVSDFTVVKGIEREKDETIVAMHHFLIKKIF